MFYRGLAFVVFATLMLTVICIPSNAQAQTKMSWSSSPTVIGTGTSGYDVHPDVVMNNNGSTMAVWNQYDGMNSNIYANRFSAGAWGTAMVIDAGEGLALYPQVAMNNKSNAVVVWNQYEGDVLTTYTRTSSRSGPGERQHQSGPGRCLQAVSNWPWTMTAM